MLLPLFQISFFLSRFGCFPKAAARPTAQSNDHAVEFSELKAKNRFKNIEKILAERQKGVAKNHSNPYCYVATPRSFDGAEDLLHLKATDGNGENWVSV